MLEECEKRRKTNDNNNKKTLLNESEQLVELRGVVEKTKVRVTVAWVPGEPRVVLVRVHRIGRDEETVPHVAATFGRVEIVLECIL